MSSSDLVREWFERVWNQNDDRKASVFLYNS